MIRKAKATDFCLIMLFDRILVVINYQFSPIVDYY